jgi:shikimate kinase
MGSGKSFLGRKASEELQLPFYDLDDLIEKKTGKSIPEIFNESGEKHFRGIEVKTLPDVERNCLLATGGGIVEMIENREFLKKPENLVIWLNTSWEVMIERIRNSDRPLAYQLDEYELFSLWEKRKELYQECADVVIPDPDSDTLIEAIRK